MVSPKPLITTNHVLRVLLLCSLTLPACTRKPPSRDFEELGSVLGKYGFVEVMPASTLLPPGTIVAIQSDSPFQASILCDAQNAFGNTLTVKWSPATTHTISQELKGSFNLNANYLAQIVGAVNASFVRSMSFTLNSTEIGELPREQIFANVNRRTSSCSTAMRNAFANGTRVSLIASVLKANAVYTLGFSSKAALDAKAKATITGGAAVKLGMSGASHDESTIKGTALFWGIRDDARYATYMPESVPGTPSTRDTMPRRLIPAIKIRVLGRRVEGVPGFRP